MAAPTHSLDRSNAAHFRAAFRMHPELDNAMLLVLTELVGNQNNSTQTMWRILQGLITKESFENVPVPGISNAKMLNEILLVLRRFESAIVVCYADQVDENTAKEFGVDPNYFVMNTQFHAITFRSMDHSRIAIILSQVYRPPAGAAAVVLGDFFAKEVILHELNHAVTTRYCLHKHEKDDEPCTPPKLAEDLACVHGECGYFFLFEKVTRGAKVEMIGGKLYLTRPCSAQKRTSIHELTAADMGNNNLSAIAWPMKRKKSGASKTLRGTKRSRSVTGDARPRDTVLVRLP